MKSSFVVSMQILFSGKFYEFLLPDTGGCYIFLDLFFCSFNIFNQCAGNNIDGMVNMLGEEVRTLVNSQYQAGYHTIKWDGTDENGNMVSNGVYLYRIQAGKFPR